MTEIPTMPQNNIPLIASMFAKEFARQGLFGGQQTQQGMQQNRNDGADAVVDKLNKEYRESIKKNKSAHDSTTTALLAQLLAAKKKIDNEGKLSKSSLKLSSDYSKLATEIQNNKISNEGAITSIENLKVESEKAAKTLTETDKASKGLTTGFIESTKEFLNNKIGFAAAGAMAMTALQQGATDMKAQMRFGTDVSNGLLSNAKDALRMGVSPAEMAELGAATRQAQNAMGGAALWGDKLSVVQKMLFKRTGDLSDSAQFSSEMMRTLGMSGIKPNIDLLMKSNGSLGSLTTQFEDIQKITGATFTDTNNMMREFAESEEIRFKLAGVNSNEQRKAILLDTVARHKNLTMLGLNTEQAKRAGAALDDLGSKDAVDRFKSAAKLQMAASALGLDSAKARELANLERKGKGRRDSDDELRYVALIGEMNTVIAASKQGNVANEFAIDALMRNIDNPLLGRGGIMTNLAEATKTNQEQLDAMKTIANDSSTTTKLMSEGIFQKDRLAVAISSNQIAMGSLSALIGLASTTKFIAGAMGIGAGGKLLGGKDKDGKVKATKGKTSILEKIKGVASKTPKVGLGVGAGIGGAMAIMGAASAAIFASADAYKAITTGESNAWNAINNLMPNVAESISDGIGWTFDNIGAMAGSEVATQRLLDKKMLAVALKENAQQTYSKAQKPITPLKPADPTKILLEAQNNALKIVTDTNTTKVSERSLLETMVSLTKDTNTYLEAIYTGNESASSKALNQARKANMQFAGGIP